MQRNVSPFLKRGTTCAILSCSGKTPVVMDRLIRCVRGFLICSIDSDRILFDIPSGPDLRLFNLSTVSVTNTSEKGAMEKLLSCGCFK